jgi:hypothetical protein
MTATAKQPKFLAVKNFSKFQHYKDRRPLWIKFYGSILDDYAFVQLPDAAKAHLMLLWQVAATHANRIPNDPKYIALATKARSKVNIGALLAAGFLIDADTIEEADDTASEVLAGGYQDASPEKSREDGEKRREETTSSVGPNFDASKSELIALLGSTALAHQEVETFLAGLDSHTRRVSWLRNLVVSLQGGGGPAIPPAAMLSALIDFNLADRGVSPYSGAVFRAFVDRAMKPRLERPAPKATDDTDEAAAAVTAIRALISVNGTSRFIPRPAVEAMGPRIVAAYDALGGATRFLKPDENIHFLNRDFAQALRTTHAA